MDEDKRQGKEPSLRGTFVSAAVVVAVAFGGFGAWATTASLDAAAVAVGTVAVETHRKTVSHLEGGILSELHVREGDLVKTGQPLVTLDTTQSDAAVTQLRSQYWASVARLARLRAEQDGNQAIDFPADLLEAARSHLLAKEAVEAERRLLTTRVDGYEGRLAVLQSKIDQLNNGIRAIEAQMSASADNLRYAQDELNSVSGLYKSGFETKPRLLALQRQVAEAKGRLGELEASKAQSEQSIAGTKMEIVSLENERSTEITDELQAVRVTVAELSQRLRAAEDIRGRSVVVAPQDGRVTNVQYFTTGGVIPSGAPIMDVVPQDDDLIVEAMVSPADIDNVHVGQAASVRLTAFRQRSTAPVGGEVVTVSADRMEDERTGNAYFAVRVRLDEASLADIPNIELHPGMPAEVMIKGESRKAIDYFLSPITDSMNRAFREE